MRLFSNCKMFYSKQTRYQCSNFLKLIKIFMVNNYLLTDLKRYFCSSKLSTKIIVFSNVSFGMFSGMNVISPVSNLIIEFKTWIATDNRYLLYYKIQWIFVFPGERRYQTVALQCFPCGMFSIRPQTSLSIELAKPTYKYTNWHIRCHSHQFYKCPCSKLKTRKNYGPEGKMSVSRIPL